MLHYHLSTTKLKYRIYLLSQITTKKRYFKTSAITVIILLLSSWVVAIFVSVHFQYTHKVADPFESFDILYDKPWQRIGPYIVGMITGYIIVRKRTAPNVPMWLNLVLWFLSIALFSIIIFGVWKGELSVPATALYVSLGHTGNIYIYFSIIIGKWMYYKRYHQFNYGFLFLFYFNIQLGVWH